METKKKKLHYGYVIVIGAFIQYFFCSGILYQCMPLFTLPVSEAFGIGQGTFTLWTTIMNIATAVCAMFMPKLVSKFKYKRMTLVSIIISGIATASLAFAPNVWLFYICGALLGACLTIMIVLYNGTIIPRWFKTRISTVIATVLIAPRIGGMVLNPITNSIIKSSGMFGFEEGWRSAFIVLGALVLVIGVVNCLILMRESPASMGLRRVGEDDMSASAGTTRVEVTRGVPAKVALKSKPFFMLVGMVACIGLFSPIFSYFPAYCTFSGASSVATFDLPGLVNSFMLIGALVGGYIIGFFNDKFGGHIGAVVGGIIGALGLALVMLGGAASPIMIVAGAILFGIPGCFTGLQYPAMTLTLFGNLDYEKIYPTAAVAAPWLAAVSYSLWGFVYDITQSYTAMFIIGMGLCLLTGVLGILAKISSKSLSDKWESREVEIKVE